MDQPNNNRKNIFATITIVLILLVIAIILFALSRRSPEQSQDQNVVSAPISNTANENSISTDSNSEVSTTKEIKGNFVSAIIPNNWTIKEYSDFTGMEMTVEDEFITYSGLTGLEIINENNTVVFSFKGVNGIGGAGGCSEVAKFSDTEQSYIEAIKAETFDIFAEETKVLDYTNKEYSPIFVLGARLRRVENAMYTASDENLTVFNTSCGVGARDVTMNDLGYTINDSGSEYSVRVYMFRLNANIINESELTKLDNILNTLKKV